MISTTGIIPNTITMGLNFGGAGQIIIGGTAGTDPAWGDLTSVGHTFAITTGINTIDLSAIMIPGANVTYHTDVGNAIPVAGILNIFGDVNINTTSGGNTVHINLDDNVHITGTWHADTAVIGHNVKISGNTISSTNVDGDVIFQPNGGGNVLMYSELLNDNTFIMDVNGNRRMPYQCCFFTYLDHAIPNVTGDETDYNVPFNVKLFDQNNNFSTVNHLFTAPITGNYNLIAGVLTYNFTSAALGWVNGLLWIQGSGGSNLVVFDCPKRHHFPNDDETRFAGGFGLYGTIVVRLNAGDTMGVTVDIGTLMKTIGVYGAPGQPYTYFGGFLIC